MKEQCRICKKYFDLSDLYEYRGAIACNGCFDKSNSLRDIERQEVIEVTKKSVESQRNGEFVNNRKKYNLNNVGSDGLPIMKIKEPERLRAYERD